MATFPSREAEIAALAGTMLHGLAENAEDFPESPVSVEVLHEALLRFNQDEARLEVRGNRGAQ